MKRETPVGLTLVVLIFLGANLFATAGARRTLEEILGQGVVESAPQSLLTEWKDQRGLQHRVTTPRRPGDSDRVVAPQHAQVVAAFLESFPAQE